MDTTHKLSLLEKISFGILLLIVFLSPFFFMPGTFLSTQFATSLLFAFGVILAFLFFILARFKEGAFEVVSPWWVSVCTLFAVPVVYTVASLVHGVSRMQFLGYTFDVSTVGFVLLSFVFLFLVSMLFRNNNRIFYSYLTIVIASLIVALFLVLRLIFGVNFLSFGIFTSLTSTVVGTWNSVGIFFGIGAILSLLTYEMLSLTRFMKVLVTIALLLSLFFLVLVNFQTIWIILSITSILFIAYKVFAGDNSFWKDVSWSHRLKKGPIYSVIVTVLSIIFIFAGTSIGNSLSGKLGISNLDVRPSLSVTYDIAQHTLEKSPLLGSGPNTFTLQWLSYKPADVNSTVFWNTDFAYGVGLLPTFAVTTGLVGILSWIAFFFTFLYFGFRSLFVKHENHFSQYITISSFFIALYLWIMTFIYIPSVVVFMLTFFFTGIFFATCMNQGLIMVRKLPFAGNPKTGFGVSLIMVALSVGGIALGYGLYKNSLSLWYFQKASYAANVTGSVDDAEKYVAQAVAVLPYDVYYRAQSEISVAKINTLLSQDLTKLDQKQVQQFFTVELSRAITSALHAKDADTNNYLNWVSLGNAYSIGASPQTQVDGAYDSAVLAYNQALKINPQNPAINLALARLEVSHADLKKAETYTLSAIAQKQNYLDAYFLLTQIKVAEKDIAGAISSVSVATQIDPTNPNIYFELGLLKYNVSDFAGAIDALQKSVSLSPNYANAKYFLGLSLAQIGNRAGAIQQFEDIQTTNPDNKDVQLILANLKAGKAAFAGAKPPVNSKPEKGSTLPVPQSASQQ